MKPGTLHSLLITGLLTGCALGPDYKQPAFPYGTQWHSELDMAEQLPTANPSDWWRQFHDPLLDDLITQGLQHNRDLAVALANIERTKALRRIAGGGYLPTLDAQANASRSRFSRQTGFGANTGTRSTYSAGLDASWELDLFGRTRRGIEAADAQIAASEAVHHGLILSVVAEIAANYFEVRGLQRQLDMTEHDIELLKEVETIARAQLEGGIVSELDLARAQGERENMQASIPSLQADITARIYRISVLTGQPPEEHAQAIERSQPIAMPSDRVPLGLRSEIILRRPDVQQAERELAAATANIGIAKADLLPSFSLTGAIGSSARVFSDLFTTGTITNSVGAALGWPVYAGGTLSAQVDVAEAEARAAMANYEQSVLLALEDTEAALMRYGKEWQTLTRLREAESSRMRAFEVARLRYESGEDDFLTLLDSERSLIATRNSIVSSETRILTNLTQLYKALGGDWQPVKEQAGSNAGL